MTEIPTRSITQLPAATTIGASDTLVVAQSGITKSAVGSLVRTYAQTGLGTAAYQNTGTTGATIPFNDGNNSFSGTVVFTSVARLVNNKDLVGRNLLDSADIPLVGVNTSNQLVLNNKQVIPWTVYTPTVSATTNDFVNVTPVAGACRYSQEFDKVFINLSINSTSVGTGTGMRISLPVSAANSAALTVITTGNTPFTGRILANSNIMQLYRYDGISVGIDNTFYIINGFYPCSVSRV